MSETRLEDLTSMVEQAATSSGDRYQLLVDLQDALREALSETDGDPSAAGR